MANLDRPRGFWPKGRIRSAEPYVAAGTVIAGEFVTMANTGTIAAAAAGADIMGLALSTGAAGDKILVSVDPEQRYVGQADEDDIDAQTDVGNLCDIVATAESSTYAAPRMEIDSDTIGTGSGGQLVILGIEARPDNALGEFVDVVVKINELQIHGENDFAGI